MIPNSLILRHKAYFIIVIQLQDLGEFPMEVINLLCMGNKTSMAQFHSIMNSNNLHHCLVLKSRLHQIFPTAVVLHAASSIGRVMQPDYFTIMLVVGDVALKVTYPQSSTVFYRVDVYGGLVFMVYTVVPNTKTN
jgi:Na+/pantothenate symporter